MSDSSAPVDLTRLLRLATSDSSYREPFLRALLANDVYFLATPRTVDQTPFSAGGFSFQIEDKRNALDFMELENNGERSTPFWTALDELENDLYRFQMGEQPFMMMSGLEFMRHARGRSVVLNPGTFGRQFTPRQIEVLVRRGEADEQARVKSLQPQQQVPPQQVPSQQVPTRQAEPDFDAQFEAQFGSQFDNQAHSPASQPHAHQGQRVHPQSDAGLHDANLPGANIADPHAESQVAEGSDGFPRPGMQDSRTSPEEMSLAPAAFSDQHVPVTASPSADLHKTEAPYAPDAPINQVGEDWDLAATSHTSGVGEVQQPSQQPSRQGGINKIPRPPMPTNAVDRESIFHYLDDAYEVIEPLLDGRSHIAWQKFRELSHAGKPEASLMQAISLLLFTVLENSESDVAKRVAKLSTARDYWSDWTLWAKQQDQIDLPSDSKLQELADAVCSCGHPAYEHGRYAWALREVGIQTEGSCERSSCTCQAFAG